MKINRLSHASSRAAGFEQLIILVDKISKLDIRVRFYENNKNNDEDDADDDDDENDDVVQPVWEDWGIFCSNDVHHQYAIILKTPPYRDQHIKLPVVVNVQLQRMSDMAESEPVPFIYTPNIEILRQRTPNQRLFQSL